MKLLIGLTLLVGILELVQRWRERSRSREWSGTLARFDAGQLTEKIRQKGKTVYSFIEGDGSNHALKDHERKYDPEEMMNTAMKKGGYKKPGRGGAKGKK